MDEFQRARLSWQLVPLTSSKEAKTIPVLKMEANGFLIQPFTKQLVVETVLRFFLRMFFAFLYFLPAALKYQFFLK